MNLTTKEKQILAEVMKSVLSDLRFEIADTEKKDFRDDLKRKEALLNKVLRVLG
ncbi:MAG: hypothetical protein GTO41_24765 [Burkholderiales bacterium]|nr:hypothetical protein [Burkholderiales bacterium]